MDDRFTLFQCIDCGRFFKVEMVENEDVVCPVCTIPRVSDEGTNVEVIEEEG
jgi:hypothetical protein